MFTKFRYTINFPIDECDTEIVIKNINKHLKIKLTPLAENSEDYNAVYNGDKYSIILSDGYGFINFAELDKDYISNIVDLLGKGLGFNKNDYDILLDNMVVDNKTKKEFMLMEEENDDEDEDEEEEQIEYRYQATFGLNGGENSYKLLNRKLDYKLKSNTGEYSCEKYQLSLDYDIGYVYFKELDKTFIKETMNKLVQAFGDDKWFWDIRDEQDDCDVKEPEEDKEELKEDDEEELLQIALISDNVLEKAQEAYQQKYNKLILSGWNEKVVEFIAVLTKYLYLIDNTNPLYKARQTKEFYAYISKNVNVMLEEPNEKKKKVLVSLLNKMISKTTKIKKELADTNKEYWVSMFNDFNLILNNADAEIKNVLNTLNASI